MAQRTPWFPSPPPLLEISKESRDAYHKMRQALKLAPLPMLYDLLRHATARLDASPEDENIRFTRLTIYDEISRREQENP